MATGDLKGNAGRLERAVKGVRYPFHVSTAEYAQAHPKTLLPILHYAFLDYSGQLATWLADRGHDLFSKTDLRFVQSIFKILREEFGYRPIITAEHFLSSAFAERKLLLAIDCIRLCKAKHEELSKAARQHRRWRADPERQEGAARGEGDNQALVACLCLSPQPSAAAEGFQSPQLRHSDTGDLGPTREEVDHADGDDSRMDGLHAAMAALESNLMRSVLAVEDHLLQAVGEVGTRLGLLEKRVQVLEAECREVDSKNTALEVGRRDQDDVPVAMSPASLPEEGGSASAEQTVDHFAEEDTTAFPAEYMAADHITHIGTRYTGALLALGEGY